MQHQANPHTVKFAQSLRKEMTDGERLLWQKLRLEQLGVKFRRQHPLGSYIADFACLAPKLIVEIDGSQHAEQQAYDIAREAYFRVHGFDVIRFPSNLPFTGLQSIIEAIFQRIHELKSCSPHPCLPPAGEGAMRD